jgi:hypothetical protein
MVQKFFNPEEIQAQIAAIDKAEAESKQRKPVGEANPWSSKGEDLLI